MTLTNAEKQRRYRQRRNSWPTTDRQMKRLLYVAYWLGRQEEQNGRKTELLWQDIERRILDAYIKQEEELRDARAAIKDLEQMIKDYNE